MIFSENRKHHTHKNRSHEIFVHCSLNNQVHNCSSCVLSFFYGHQKNQTSRATILQLLQQLPGEKLKHNFHTPTPVMICHAKMSSYCCVSYLGYQHISCVSQEISLPCHRHHNLKDLHSPDSGLYCCPQTILFSKRFQAEEKSLKIHLILKSIIRVMLFNATFNNISAISVVSFISGGQQSKNNTPVANQ